MNKYIRVAPPNSMFFIEDLAGGQSPKIDDRPIKIWSSRSCIIIGCLAFMDGETDFIISDLKDRLPAGKPALDEMFDTPSRVLTVSTSEREILQRCDVPATSTRIRVWTNRLVEPSEILTILG